MASEDVHARERIRPHGTWADRDFGWVMLVVILTALTLARIGALALSPAELGFDEAQYWAWSRDLAFGYFSKPPMIAWFMALEQEICGSGASCLRAGSPLLHFATALVLAALARRLYGAATGFWTGVFYAVIPGVAFSSALLTTDALLLLFWSAALLALFAYLERPGWGGALAFGVLAGAGLNAKYAMAYLPILVLLAAVAERTVRRAVFRAEALGALAIMGLMIAPNIVWNLENSLATFSHTGENIGWSLDRLNAVKGFEFFVAQFGVAGPIVFGAMLAALLFHVRSERPETDRVLLWLSMPIIGALVIQGFLSQANVNWGAATYPAGLILATALIVRRPRRTALIANLIICIPLALGAIVATATFEPRTAERPLHKLRELDGWSETAASLAAMAERANVTTVVTSWRPFAAGLTYALRDTPITVRAYLPSGEAPSDQFQLEVPWTEGDATDGVLLFGFDRQTALSLGARPLGEIAAPIFTYADRGGRAPIYGFSDD